VNDFMVKNTGLEDLCSVGELAVDFQKLLTEVFQKEFSQSEISKRKERLEMGFSNQEMAREVKGIIF